MDFLQLAGRSILIMGVANRKSVAWHIAQILKEAGADVLYAVRSTARQDSIRKLVGDAPSTSAMSRSRIRSIDSVKRSVVIASSWRVLCTLSRSLTTAPDGSRFTRRRAGPFCRLWISPASR